MHGAITSLEIHGELVEFGVIENGRNFCRPDDVAKVMFQSRVLLGERV